MESPKPKRRLYDEANGNPRRICGGLRRHACLRRGGAITVNLAGREDILSIAKSDLPLVVQWTTEPDASFMLDSETARKFKIKKATIEVTDGETVTTVSGLKLTRKSGTMLIVK